MPIPLAMLRQALGRFRRRLPGKYFRVDDLSQNLQAVDEPRTGTIEVRGAVDGVDPPVSYRRYFIPSVEA
jgi:hypothetical protein